MQGVAWPAMHHMAAQWIPADERSKFVTAYLGSSVGIAIFYPLFGYVCKVASWEWVFHLTAILGTLWWLAWLRYVYDTPAEHPDIDAKERSYIERSLEGVGKKNVKRSAPWGKILTSVPVWAIVAGQWGGIWGLFTLMTQTPTYFKIIHGWSVEKTGLLCGVPHMMRMIFAYIFSIFGDSLLRNNKMSRTNVRKFAGIWCFLVNGGLCIMLAYTGCNDIAAIVLVTLATAVHGAMSTGPLAGMIDISPNFSGVILGLTSMIATIPGFISPYIVGRLTNGRVSHRRQSNDGYWNGFFR